MGGLDHGPRRRRLACGPPAPAGRHPGRRPRRPRRGRSHRGRPWAGRPAGRSRRPGPPGRPHQHAVRSTGHGLGARGSVRTRWGRATSPRGQVVVVRRDRPGKEPIPVERLAQEVPVPWSSIQQSCTTRRSPVAMTGPSTRRLSRRRRALPPTASIRIPWRRSATPGSNGWPPMRSRSVAHHCWTATSRVGRRSGSGRGGGSLLLRPGRWPGAATDPIANRSDRTPAHGAYAVRRAIPADRRREPSVRLYSTVRIRGRRGRRPRLCVIRRACGKGASRQATTNEEEHGVHHG